MEITVETRRVFIRRSQNLVWCIECLSPVQFLTPQEAAVLAGVNASTIDRLAEDGQLHSIATAEQSRLICLNSLLKN